MSRFRPTVYRVSRLLLRTRPSRFSSEDNDVDGLSRQLVPNGVASGDSKLTSRRSVSALWRQLDGKTYRRCTFAELVLSSSVPCVCLSIRYVGFSTWHTRERTERKKEQARQRGVRSRVAAWRMRALTRTQQRRARRIARERGRAARDPSRCAVRVRLSESEPTRARRTESHEPRVSRPATTDQSARFSSSRADGYSMIDHMLSQLHAYPLCVCQTSETGKEGGRVEEKLAEK